MLAAEQGRIAAGGLMLGLVWELEGDRGVRWRHSGTAVSNSLQIRGGRTMASGNLLEQSGLSNPLDAYHPILRAAS
jgi:hypothetical protein